MVLCSFPRLPTLLHSTAGSCLPPLLLLLLPQAGSFPSCYLHSWASPLGSSLSHQDRDLPTALVSAPCSVFRMR